MAQTQDEVERKYSVSHDVTLPALTKVDGIADVGPVRQSSLAATYFDTAELALLQHGVTLRRKRAAPTRDGTSKSHRGPTRDPRPISRWGVPSTPSPSGCAPLWST